VSANPEPRVDPATLEEKRQQINRLIDEVARLAESTLGPAEFFAEFLQRMLIALAAPAGVIWNRTPQGNLQMAYQINFQEIGLDQIEGARASHDELLRILVQQGRSLIVPPYSGPGKNENGVAAANLTGYNLLLVPISVERQINGVIEIWVDPDRNPNAIRGFIQFLEDMATYAGSYLRNHQLRFMLGQQQVWTQLESFARQIHSTLNVREVSYLIANECRRMLQVDRVSLACRMGAKTDVEAISGADVIEKRSALVQSMRALCDAVLVWNDKLIYAGARDESLPPKVLDALDKYLAESNSKLLIILPMRDDRENKEYKKDLPCRSVMMVECFEPNITTDQLMARVDVLAKHSAPALYNALEYRRLPFKWALTPIANIKDGLRGRRGAIAAAITAGLAVLVLLMCIIPWELRMDAKGKLVPKDRQTAFAQFSGQIRKVNVQHGQKVKKGQPLLEINDPNLSSKFIQLQAKIKEADQRITSLTNSINTPGLNPQQLETYKRDRFQAIFDRESNLAELNLLRAITPNPDAGVVVSPITGTVVTFDLTQLQNRIVKPGDPLLEIAKVGGDWEIELQIPEAHVGHIRDALARVHPEGLEVDIRLSSHAGKDFKGKLFRDGLGGSATMVNNEPVLTARVKVGPELKEELDRLEGGAMPIRTEVVAKVRCGKRPVGYVWFYQLWEFLYERVIF
jgi:hypothetical protein